MPPTKRYDVAIVGLVLTAVLQFGTAVWWASSITERISSCEVFVERTQEIPVAVAVLQQQITTLNGNLKRLNDELARRKINGGV